MSSKHLTSSGRRAANIAFCFDNFGWSFTPLDGKKPMQPEWQKKDRETREQALSWGERGNVGLRTGSNSGVLVVDVDNGGDIAPLNLPATVAVRTGSDGLHLYYRCAEPIGNSAGKLGPHIDTRGCGGQVVFPGSVHPETGQEYQWEPGCDPWSIEIAELPPHIIELLKAEKPKRTTKASKAENPAPDPQPAENPGQAVNPRLRKYVESAFQREIDAVSRAVEGGRNDQLNTSAFNLGQLVGTAGVTEAHIMSALADAGRACGLPDDEAAATIRSGVNAGLAKPRHIELEMEIRERAKEKGYLLKSGAHVTDTGQYVEQSNLDYAEQAIAALPADLLYRKASHVGDLLGAQGHQRWDELSDEYDMVLILDRHIKSGRWVKSRKGKEEGEPVMKYEPAEPRDAKAVRSLARSHPAVRELNLLVNYPVYGPGFNRIEPGWRDGFYYDEPAELRGLEPDTDREWIHNVLYDLVCDFPFRAEADKQNFIGLLLTPIVAPALEGNRPLHLIHASLERTGKSKLAGDVFGGLILGRQTPPVSLTEREDEREKRILAWLLQGETLIHLDNLPRFIDSPSLSSLLTAEVFGGRILGQTRHENLPNFLTIVASGNNVQFTGEVAKRIVPIMLQPKTARPEARRDFQHNDLTGFVRQQRREVLACLLGMVENWKSAGQPMCPNYLGGFERWSAVIGGILGVNAMTKWRTNEAAWRDQADPRGAEMTHFVAEWAASYGRDEMSPSTLIELAKGMDAFGHVTSKPGAAASFGKMLQGQRDTPVGEWVIRYDFRSGRPAYWLEPLAVAGR